MKIHTMNNFSILNQLEIDLLKSIENKIINEEKFTIRSIAKENFISTTILFKLSKKLGFEGYSEMIYYLKDEINLNSKAISYETLEPLINNFNKNVLTDFIELLNNSSQRIALLGLGYSELVCDYFSRKLSLFDFSTYNGAHLDVILKGQHQKNLSMLIVISKSGETEDVLKFVKNAKNYDLKVISFTSNSKSAIAQNSFLHFEVNCTTNSMNIFEADTFSGKVILIIEYMLQLYNQQKN
ncbi:MurR/RpiR family transcriptional regulator [Oceanobacillus jeddahense]|uniref:MurR/RpiR family transcriptional regulator n=1 Tax=Oceanobacillus jeddahense TaxID=1462527 RepID=A0ABY5JLA7_9BACI|nr:MurR/RpiR family transcriptional regulator [Oceanobacillus jeddahense]UUI01082.1 MurR/RpiR family transcriptional regulator [Oceanobacillus jeddahense]